MVGVDEHDDVVDTFVQDIGAIGMRVSGELGSHIDLLPSTRSGSISSSHTADSIGQLAASHFQRDQLWAAREQESFIEYLLESSNVRGDSYKVSEDTLI